jgi:hypothetical protein
MPIKRQGRFLLFTDNNMPVSLGLESEALGECLAEIRSKPYYGVFATNPWGFREEDVACLAEIPHVTLAWLWDIRLKNLSGLYALPSLQNLRLSDDHPSVDFSRLPMIESLVLQYGRMDQNTDSLFSCRTLHLWRFHPKSKSWTDFRFPPNLQSLQINWANPADLEGWPILPDLQEIEFHRCRSLTDVGRLAEIAPNLKRIIIDACGRVTRLNLDEFKKLEFAVLNHERKRG